MRRLVVESLIVFSLLSGVAYVVDRPIVEEPLPLFEVGSCIQLSGEREIWEAEASLFKVMEQGNKNYKVCPVELCSAALDDRIDFISIPFTDRAIFEQVSCGGQ